MALTRTPSNIDIIVEKDAKSSPENVALAVCEDERAPSAILREDSRNLWSQLKPAIITMGEEKHMNILNNNRAFVILLLASAVLLPYADTISDVILTLTWLSDEDEASLSSALDYLESGETRSDSAALAGNSTFNSKLQGFEDDQSCASVDSRHGDLGRHCGDRWYGIVSLYILGISFCLSGTFMLAADGYTYDRQKGRFYNSESGAFMPVLGLLLSFCQVRLPTIAMIQATEVYRKGVQEKHISGPAKLVISDREDDGTIGHFTPCFAVSEYCFYSGVDDAFTLINLPDGFHWERALWSAPKHTGLVRSKIVKVSDAESLKDADGEMVVFREIPEEEGATRFREWALAAQRAGAVGVVMCVDEFPDNPEESNMKSAFEIPVFFVKEFPEDSRSTHIEYKHINLFTAMVQGKSGTVFLKMVELLFETLGQMVLQTYKMAHDYYVRGRWSSRLERVSISISVINFSFGIADTFLSLEQNATKAVATVYFASCIVSRFAVIIFASIEFGGKDSLENILFIRNAWLFFDLVFNGDTTPKPVRDSAPHILDFPAKVAAWLEGLVSRFAGCQDLARRVPAELKNEKIVLRSFFLSWSKGLVHGLLMSCLPIGVHDGAKGDELFLFPSGARVHTTVADKLLSRRALANLGLMFVENIFIWVYILIIDSPHNIRTSSFCIYGLLPMSLMAGLLALLKRVSEWCPAEKPSFDDPK